MSAAKTQVAQVADLGDGQGKVVDVAGRSLAVFNVGGRFYAIDNLCPHRGGPLGEGDVEGAIVVCPWHGWRWDVTSGRNCWPGTDWRVPRVPVRVLQVGERALIGRT